MKIIIDIPDKIFNGYKEIGEIYNTKDFSLFRAIINGTPLPKGHGRLIDAKDAYKKFYNRSMAKIGKEVLDETPTIIEADKENE